MSEAPENSSNDDSVTGSADEELLSKEEIDTLLTGVDEGDIDTSAGAVDGEAVLFDFTSRDQIVRGRLPTLEMLNKRFARFFRSSLADMVLDGKCGVLPTGIVSCKYQELADKQTVPVSMNWVSLPPLQGSALMMFDAALVFKLVDLYFGGRGQVQTIAHRDFTMTEQRVVSKVLHIALAAFCEAWTSIIQFKPVIGSSECNAGLTNVLSPTESIISSAFEIDLAGETGVFHLVLPVAMLEPIRDTLDAGIQSDVEVHDHRWAALLRTELLNADMELNCTVVQRQIELREILDLKEGDVIPVDIPETVTLHVDQRKLFNARLGVSGEKMAAEIREQ